MAVKKLTADEIRQIYDGMKGDVTKFARIMFKGVCGGGIPEFHREIYKAVVENERVALAAPRGFAKSTIISKIYPLWLALFRKRVDICIISASETLAVEHLRWIKNELESNPKVLQGWGDLRSDKWTESHLVLKFQDGHRVTLRAKGAGGQIRGFRPDCLILDDIETDESVISEEQRKKIKDWIFKACLNTLLPGGQMLLMGTLIHPLSVLNDLLVMPNGWFKKKYQAYKEGREEEGFELWPECRPHEWLQQRKREIGSWAFAAEFMNDPRSDDSAPIKDSMIRYWESLPKQLGLVIAVDPAYSDDESSDFKVACLVGIDHLHNRYLVDYIRTHVPTGEFMDSIINLYLRHKGSVTAIGVPDNGVEKQFYDSFQKKCEARGIFPPITPLSNSFTNKSGTALRNKKARIVAALQPLFEQGKYYIHANHVEAREELLEIGNSRWDDVVDALSYAEQILTPVYYEEKQEWKEDRRLVTSGSYGIEY